MLAKLAQPPRVLCDLLNVLFSLLSTSVPTLFS